METTGTIASPTEHSGWEKGWGRKRYSEFGAPQLTNKVPPVQCINNRVNLPGSRGTDPSEAEAATYVLAQPESTAGDAE